MHEVYVILPSQPTFPLPKEIAKSKKERKEEKIPLQTSFPLTNRVSPSPVELTEQFISDLPD